MTILRRVRTVATGVAGTPWYSNFHFTWVSGTEQDHLDLISNWWSAIVAQLDNTVTWNTEDDMALIDDATGNITGVETGTGSAVVGAETANALPPANQGLVHWFTSSFVGGRQLRGRTFIPGMCVDQTTSVGALQPATRTDFAAAADDLIANSSTPGPFRVLSRTNGTSAVVDTASVPSFVAVMRSRRD